MPTLLIALFSLLFPNEVQAVTHAPEFKPAIKMGQGYFYRALQSKDIKSQELLRTALTAASKALDTTDVLPAPEEQAKDLCQGNRTSRMAVTSFNYMLFVGEINPTIYLCPTILDEITIERMAQAIVHEAFHAAMGIYETDKALVHYSDEQATTELEIMTIFYGGGVPAKNNYVDLYRLNEYVDPLIPEWQNWTLVGKILRQEFNVEKLSKKKNRYLDVQVIIDGKLNPDLDLSWQDFYRNDSGLTPLMTAVWNRKYAWARFLLENGAVNTFSIRDRHGMTALDAAKHRHDDAMVALLEEFGA